MAEADYDDEMSAADIKVCTAGTEAGGGGIATKPLRRSCAAAHQATLAPHRPQAALLDSLYGTERGLAARSEVRAEINELITQLEAKNPNPSPNEVRLISACQPAGACGDVAASMTALAPRRGCWVLGRRPAPSLPPPPPLPRAAIR